MLMLGCGDDSTPIGDDGGDAGDAAQEASAYPAAHPPMPQVVTNGGPVMKSPKAVPITFQSDTAAAQLEQFVTKIAGSNYWTAATSEYGVGALTAESAIRLSETPPTTMSDAQVQAWLTSKIVNGDDAGPPFPQPDDDTVYVVFFPASVTITLMGFPSCNGFDGYHSDFKIGSQKVAYAVLMRCTTLGAVTLAASHELVEVATDPFSADTTTAAYYQPDADHFVWEYGGGGGEIADMCSAFPNASYVEPDLGYIVQHVWSNARAAASHDPCAPNGATPYFNSAPVLGDTVTVNDPMAGTFTTKCVHVPVGQTGTVELDLYSDAPTSGPWTIEALDVASAIYGGPPELTFSFDKTQGQNGDKVQLSITPIKAGQGGASAFWIQNTLGATKTVWLGLVGN